MQFSHDNSYQLEKRRWREYFDFWGSKMNDRQDLPFDCQNLISPDHRDRRIRKLFLERWSTVLVYMWYVYNMFYQRHQSNTKTLCVLELNIYMKKKMLQSFLLDIYMYNLATTIV